MADKKETAAQKRHGKNVHAVELGKLGGKVGGPARAAALSDAERSAIAKKGGEARWQEHNRHASDDPNAAKKYRERDK